ncbi:MAG: DUF362 domain-containing protein [Proteobacteria bacterium]|nr:DUF362 domain-containing protein [Pseudomonadota bacterium]
MAKVALVGCETYEDGEVKKAVDEGIGLLGGAGEFAAKGERILLKPNLLVPEVPQKCVTTHPSVFRAVAEAFLTTGAEIRYGDSPAMGNTLKAAKKSGLADVAQQLKIELADFKTGVDVFYEQGRQNKKFVVAKGVLESDGLVSLPKLKTHALERFTGCIKNQFGCIPGVLKGEYHVKLSDAADFGKMLVDLNNYIKPRLYIMDGIQAMEGNGPRGGTPKRMNVLLFSSDPVALDATVCRMIDINPAYVPTTKFGMEFGAGTWLKEEIELVGDDFDRFRDDRFKIKRTPVDSYRTKGAQRFMNNRLVSKPFILEDKCNACGNCVSMCPADPKAVDWIDGDLSNPPTYNYDECIRCYCCQEICPEGAIKLKVPVVRKMLDRVLF